MSFLFALSACAPIVSLAGSSGATVFLATQFDRVVLLADGVSYVQTGKTLSDRALSNVVGADCSAINVATGKPLCSNVNNRAPVEDRQLAAASGVAIGRQQAPMPAASGVTPLPAVLKSEIERFDCTSSTPHRHARIAFETQGGEVRGFAYHSIWKPLTCSIHLMRDTSGIKWIAAPDGTNYVHTPQGRFVIRTSVDAYVLEFQNVQRGKFCGMPGEINGTMTIRRDPATPHCSVRGVMDANDPYPDGLYGSAPVEARPQARTNAY